MILLKGFYISHKNGSKTLKKKKSINKSRKCTESFELLIRTLMLQLHFKKKKKTLMLQNLEDMPCIEHKSSVSLFVLYFMFHRS